MADSENTHFWIPPENIRVEKVVPHGGGKPFARNDYASHGAKLGSQISQLGQIVVKKADSSLTNDFIVQIKSPANTSAKEQRIKYSSLGFEVISYSNRDESSATVKIPKRDFESLVGKVEKYTNEPTHPGKTAIGVMEELSEVPIEEKVDPIFLEEGNKVYSCIISIYNILSKMEKNAILDRILETIEKKGIKGAEKKIYLSGNVVVSANLSTKLIKELGASYYTVRSITQNFTAETVIAQSYPTAALKTPLKIGNPTTNAIVGVIDSGIVQHSPAFKDLVVDTRTYLPVGSVGPGIEHGTLVASRLIYGDELENATNWLLPHCKVLDIQVFGKIPNLVTKKLETRGLSEDILTDVMDKVVKDFHKTVKVYNLSLGLGKRQIDSYSVLAMELDYLSREYGVLFVVSSGNVDGAKLSFPNHLSDPSVSTIKTPGESLLSITVGSFAKYSDKGAMSRENELSPFSCIGPGSDGGIKPEVVAHGGNVPVTPRVGAYGIHENGTQIAYNVGTSFSAPLVSQLAARLFSHYDNPTPNLVRALLCHFTEPVLVPKMKIDPSHMVGFGRPDIDRALYDLNSSATYLYQGQILNETYQSIQFHVPKCLASGGNSKLKIRITLAYNPPINIDNHSEYSKCRISMSASKQTDSGLKEIQVSAWKENTNLPWNPVLHCENEFSRSFATGEWELTLRLFTRGKLPADYKQDFALVIQVLDSKGKAEVYKEILDTYGHQYKAIKLRKAA